MSGMDDIVGADKMFRAWPEHGPHALERRFVPESGEPIPVAPGASQHMYGAKFLMESLEGGFRFTLREDAPSIVDHENPFSTGGNLVIWKISTTTDGGEDIRISLDDFIVFIQMFLPHTQLWKNIMTQHENIRWGSRKWGPRSVALLLFEQYFCLGDVKDLQKTLVNVEKYLTYMKHHEGNIYILVE